MPYTSLLENEALPDCARRCAGACPTVNLFDTHVYLHPDIKSQIEFENGAIPSNSDFKAAPNTPACPYVPFNADDHHGTLLSSIIASQDDGKAQFEGLAPRTKIRVYPAASMGAKEWSNILQERENLNFDEKPQLFVFASQLKYGIKDYDEDGKQLPNEDFRKLHPPLVNSIASGETVWITAAGQYDNRPGDQFNKQSPESPMNLGDLKNIIVVSSCTECVGADARLWPNAFYSNDGLVNMVAPGGKPEEPIPGPADDHQYSMGFGTSQSTAFLAGVAAAMMSCYPEYSHGGRWIKTRLQTTAQPMPNPDDAQKVTGGIVNIERALLAPHSTWFRTRSSNAGFDMLQDEHWCADTISLKDADTPDALGSFTSSDVGSILQVQRSSLGNVQWQVSQADPNTALVKWSPPGAWPDDNAAIIAGKKTDGSSIVITAGEIVAIVPRLDAKLPVTRCVND